MELTCAGNELVRGGHGFLEIAAAAAPLLKSARLTVQQIEDRNARLPVQSQIRLLEVAAGAWLLGYQEVSAFTHAFKRWTGVTPRKMRTKAEPTHDSR